MSKTVLTAIFFPSDDIAVCQGASHDVCVQGDDKEECVARIKNQIHWHDSKDGSDGNHFVDLPSAPEIYQTIYTECEQTGDVEIISYDDYEIKLVTATDEQRERTRKALDTPENRAFLQKLASYAE